MTAERRGTLFIFLSALLYSIGGLCIKVIPWNGMSINGAMPLQAAAVLDLAYWPGDVIKTVIAALVAVAVHRAFPDLFAPVAPVVDSERTSAHIG